MRLRLALSSLGLALAVQIGVQSVARGAEQTGLQAMQYYVGMWACTGGTTGAPTKGTIEYRIDGGALRDTVAAAEQGTPSRPWLSVETKYDPNTHLFVNTAFDNGGWDVSYAKPWTANTEEWFDHSTADGKLGHARVVRVNKNEYVYTGFTTPTGTKQSFKITCTRSK